jgi:hypothetical protein
MSLTSYRAAPPRVKSMRVDDRRIGRGFLALGRSGSDLLSRALRHSTIGAESFHVRVRNGIGCTPFASATRSSKREEEVLSRVQGRQRMSTAARNE